MLTWHGDDPAITSQGNGGMQAGNLARGATEGSESLTTRNGRWLCAVGKNVGCAVRQICHFPAV